MPMEAGNTTKSPFQQSLSACAPGTGQLHEGLRVPPWTHKKLNETISDTITEYLPAGYVTVM